MQGKSRVMLLTFAAACMQLSTAMEIRKEEESGEASHEFGALNTLLLVVILGICIMCAYLIKSNSFYYLPESGACLMVGVVVGAMARQLYPDEKELEFLSFQPEMFFFMLLPPIIFEAGYSLEQARFFSNLGSITLFAVMGTLISTFVVGYGTAWCAEHEILHLDTKNTKETLKQSLMFGALISAVDPVATLSIMGNPEINCNPLLYSLVFGESVLNDAVAIVLFRTFQVFTGEFTNESIGTMVFDFTYISVGSLICGVVLSLGCSFLCKETNICNFPEYEMCILLLFAYGSYAFAEAIELSGIMSLFFCGIVLAHYNNHNLSNDSAVCCEHIFKSFALIAEFFVFIYMGMGFCTGKFGAWNLTFSILALFFCIIGRFLNIFPLAAIANSTGRRHKITFNMQIVMWFAGLRGAIAFALAQNMPGKNKDLFITTTLFVIVFTTMVCGGLTEPMLSAMGMKVAAGYHAPTDQKDSSKRQSKFTKWIVHIEEKIMKPNFGGERWAKNRHHLGHQRHSADVEMATDFASKKYSSEEEEMQEQLEYDYETDDAPADDSE